MLSLDPEPKSNKGKVFLVLVLIGCAGGVGYWSGRRSALRAVARGEVTVSPETAAGGLPVQPISPAARADAAALAAYQAQAGAGVPAMAQGNGAVPGMPPATGTAAGLAQGIGTGTSAATGVAAGGGLQSGTAPAGVPGAGQAPGMAAVDGRALPAGWARLATTLHGSLEQSVESALPAGSSRDVAEQLTQVVNRLLVWKLQIAHDGRPGDRLDVLYELPGAGSAPAPGSPSFGERPPAFPQEPVVHALRYDSQKLVQSVTAFRFKAPGATFARYYQADGTEVEERLVGSPIDDYEQITSLLKDGRHHKGVDFKTPVGTPVHSPFDGVVVRRNWNFGMNGNCLEIADGHSGRHAIFLHLERVDHAMSAGRHVTRGEQLAVSGNTGRSTAPHLHYQLESPDGRVLDPFAVHATRRIALEGDAKAAFDSELKRLETLLADQVAGVGPNQH